MRRILARCRDRWRLLPIRRRSPGQVAALTFVLACIPIAAMTGASSCSAIIAETRSDTTKRSAEATLLEDPQRTGSYRYRARTQWSSDGRIGTATVEVPRTASRGERLTLWLDSDDTPTTAPLTGTQAVMTGIGIATAIVVAVGIGAWGLVRIADGRRGPPA
ncbi:hypothetical protein [Nocardia brasiliensis]|nr:hypothetical protein [Nocardia brasiliensis]